MIDLIIGFAGAHKIISLFRYNAVLLKLKSQLFGTIGLCF